MAFQKALTTFIGLGDAINQFSSPSPQAPETQCGGGYMTQWVDHSNHSRGIFQQQIQVNTEYFKPGGPILLFQGEESAKMICVESTSLLEYARQLGGIAAAIEHRYFGLSTPFGPDESYTHEGFKYLTLDNVMDDTVKFIREVQANVTGASHSQAIVASGSYGAFLTTALRLNRPDDIFGAISAAPPVRGFLPADGDAPYRFGWWDWVSNVIADKSATAAMAIKNAFSTLKNTIDEGNFDELQSKLNLCQAVNGSEDADKLVDITMMPYNLVTEFNYPYVSEGRSPIAYPLDHLVQTVLAHKDDPFRLLREAVLLWFQALDPTMTCINLNLTPAEAVPLIQWTPWLYITCSFVPLTISCISKESIFIPRDSDPDEASSFCEPTYGVTPMTEDQLVQRYNLTQAAYESSERIIFSVGQWDPVTAMAPPYLPSTSDRNASKILYVSNMAHREELFAEHPLDKPEVIRARAVELETIKGWLGTE